MDWPHAPAHRLSQAGAYIVTGGAYLKEHHFASPERRTFLRDLLLETAEEFGWRMQAWAVMSNHYHFVSLSPEDPSSLKKMISKVHTLSAREINKEDGVKGRKVWHQYWDSYISLETSYYARLNYVHQNPVHHEVVRVADQYEWCSARWFVSNAEAAFRKTVFSFKTGKVKVMDDF